MGSSSPDDIDDRKKCTSTNRHSLAQIIIVQTVPEIYIFIIEIIRAAVRTSVH